jgi:hypothetical protein
MLIYYGGEDGKMENKDKIRRAFSLKLMPLHEGIIRRFECIKNCRNSLLYTNKVKEVSQEKGVIYWKK